MRAINSIEYTYILLFSRVLGKHTYTHTHTRVRKCAQTSRDECITQDDAKVVSRDSKINCPGKLRQLRRRDGGVVESLKTDRCRVLLAG
jgi:hypothetical protein